MPNKVSELDNLIHAGSKTQTSAKPSVQVKPIGLSDLATASYTVKSGDAAEPVDFSAVYGETGKRALASKPTTPVISPESQENLRRIGSTPLAPLSFAAPKGAVGTAQDAQGNVYYHDSSGNNLGPVPSKVI
jgi:hypothetical protein